MHCNTNTASAVKLHPVKLHPVMHCNTNAASAVKLHLEVCTLRKCRLATLTMPSALSCSGPAASLLIPLYHSTNCPLHSPALLQQQRLVQQPQPSQPLH